MVIERTTFYFEKPGEQNTEEVLKIAKDTAVERGLETVLVSSSRGVTGIKAANIFKGTGIKLIVVSHQTGYRDPGVQLLTEENRKKLEQQGVKILTSTDVLTGGVDIGMARVRTPSDVTSVARVPSILPPVPTIVANTLRLFCQGVKVCVEIAMMAADAGIIPVDKSILCVAGSHAGADTAVLLIPSTSNRMLDLKVLEVVARPL